MSVSLINVVVVLKLLVSSLIKIISAFSLKSVNDRFIGLCNLIFPNFVVVLKLLIFSLVNIILVFSLKSVMASLLAMCNLIFYWLGPLGTLAKPNLPDA